MYSSPLTRLLQGKRAQEHHHLVHAPLVVHYGTPQMTGHRVAGWRDNWEVGKVGGEDGWQGEHHSKNNLIGCSKPEKHPLQIKKLISGL